MRRVVLIPTKTSDITNDGEDGTIVVSENQISIVGSATETALLAKGWTITE